MPPPLVGAEFHSGADPFNHDLNKKFLQGVSRFRKFVKNQRSRQVPLTSPEQRPVQIPYGMPLVAVEQGKFAVIGQGHPADFGAAMSDDSDHVILNIWDPLRHIGLLAHLDAGNMSFTSENPQQGNTYGILAMALLNAGFDLTDIRVVLHVDGRLPRQASTRLLEEVAQGLSDYLMNFRDEPVRIAFIRAPERPNILFNARTGNESYFDPADIRLGSVVQRLSVEKALWEPDPRPVQEVKEPLVISASRAAPPPNKKGPRQAIPGGA